MYGCGLIMPAGIMAQCAADDQRILTARTPPARRRTRRQPAPPCAHRIAAEIADAGGWIPFARFMELALYAPGLGYYAGGSHKFGAERRLRHRAGTDAAVRPGAGAAGGAGDGRSSPAVIEAGAGSGRLAADLLLALERSVALPERYLILELSGELRARQRRRSLPSSAALADRVDWLDALPERFSGWWSATNCSTPCRPMPLRWRERRRDGTRRRR